jgi:hypothetical protein
MSPKPDGACVSAPAATAGADRRGATAADKGFSMAILTDDAERQIACGERISAGDLSGVAPRPH